MKKNIQIITIAVVIFLSIFGCATEDCRMEDFLFYNNYRIAVSPSGKDVIVIESTRRPPYDYETSSIYINNKHIGRYKDVGDVRFSPDGEKYFFTYSENGCHSINVNGKIYAGLEKYGSGPQFIDTILIFSANKKDQPYIYIDGEIIHGKWAGGFNDSVVVKGSHVGFSYRIPRDSLNDYYYVKISKKKYGPFSSVGPFVTNDDGSIIGCRCGYTDTSGISGKSVIIINNKVLGAYYCADNLHVDRSRFWFTYRDEYKSGQWHLRINDTIYTGLDQTLASKEVSDIYFNFEKNNKTYVYIKGNVYGGFDEVFDVRFDTIKKNFIIHYLNNEKYGVQINQKQYSGVEDVVFNKEGSVFNFGFLSGQEGNYFVNVNGKTYGPFADASGPYFSEDGKSYGFSYNKGGYIPNGPCGGKCEPIGGKWYVRVNDVIHGGYDRPAWGPSFNPGSSDYWFQYMGIDDNQMKVNYFLWFKGKKYFMPEYRRIQDIVFSNDGSKLIFIFEKKDIPGTFVQVNDKIYGPYRAVNYAVASDSRVFIGYVDCNQKKLRINIEEAK